MFHELEEICQALLGHFEGRSPGLEGKFYGVVIIHREATVQKSHAGVGIVKSTQMRVVGYFEFSSLLFSSHWFLFSYIFLSLSACLKIAVIAARGVQYL